MSHDDVIRSKLRLVEKTEKNLQEEKELMTAKMEAVREQRALIALQTEAVKSREEHEKKIRALQTKDLEDRAAISQLEKKRAEIMLAIAEAQLAKM